MIVGLLATFFNVEREKIMAASQRRKPMLLGFWFTAADRGWFEANR
jgi:hypothetical protein